MHLRRIAHLLADLVVRHGLSADADATVAGRHGSATYVVPLLVQDGDRRLLVDGDLTGRPVDNVTLAQFRAACQDTGATGLFLHDGPLSSSALRAVGDRVHVWSLDTFAELLGASAVADALDRPLPALPGLRAWPLPEAAEPTPVPATEPDLAILDVPSLDQVPAELLDLADDVAAEPAEAAPLLAADDATELELSPVVDAPLDLVGLDHVIILDDDVPETPATMALAALDAVSAQEPVALEPAGAPALPAEPFIELADETPVLHLEEATATVAEVEPAPAAATEAPDVIPLTEVPPPPAPAPAVDVLAAPVFEVPTVNDLLPPAFRETPVAPPMAPAPEPVVPAVFNLPEVPAVPDGVAGEPLRAPEGSQGLLPARVTLVEAKAQVADRLFSIEEAELILQPVHLYDYSVDLLRPGKVTSSAVTGRLQVNGTDRRVTATDPAKSDPRLPHRVAAHDGLSVMDKVLRVGPDRAEQLATAWAQAEHAKVVEVTTDRADDTFTVVEKRSIAPTSGQVTLTPLGLWHRPFWRLWGANGHADIDAVEGHVLDEEIKTPNPDFLVVD